MNEEIHESKSNAYVEPASDAKRKLIGCLGGLGIFLAMAAVIYLVGIQPSKRIEQIAEQVDALRHDCPPSVSEENWNRAIELTLQLHKQCNFSSMPVPEVVQFSQQLDDRIQLEKMKPETIFWIWDQYAAVSRDARRYSAIWHNELVKLLGVDPLAQEN